MYCKYVPSHYICELVFNYIRDTISERNFKGGQGVWGDIELYKDDGQARV